MPDSGAQRFVAPAGIEAEHGYGAG